MQMRCSCKAVAIVAIAALSVIPGYAGADTITFEPPTYSTGALGGQDGWNTGLFGGPVFTADIATAAPGSGEPALVGAQSAYLASGGLSTSPSVNRATAARDVADLTQDGSIFGFRVQTIDDGISGGFEEEGLFAALSPNIGTGATPVTVNFHQSNVRVYNGSGVYQSVGVFNQGDIYDVTATLNFTNQTYAVTLENITLGTPAAALGTFAFASATASFTHVMLGASNNARGLFDDVTLVVPEPNSVILLALAAGLTTRSRGRRRRF
jgi:hypothetical protein